MKIQWLKNSTFLIKNSIGKKILIDPFTVLNTFENIICSDIICFSKNLANQFPITDDSTKIISVAEDYSDDTLKIKSYLTFSDNLGGLKRGVNSIFTFDIDGYKLCHLGYLDEIPNNELIKLFKGVDFLFLPIGGNICLNGRNAFKLAQLLKPKYILPMCYKCSNSDFYFDSPKEFLSFHNDILILKDNVLDTDILPTDAKELVVFFNSFENKKEPSILTTPPYYS